MAKRITSFNRKNLSEIRTLIDDALTKALKPYGLSGNIGRITFAEHDFRCQVSVACGDTSDAAKREWDKYCTFFGMKKEDFGRSFTTGKDAYVISGLKPKGRKYPILATATSTEREGTTYKFSANRIKELLV